MRRMEPIAAPLSLREYFPRRFTLVGLCFCATFICYIDRVNISVAIIPMSAEFGWDRTVGLLAGTDSIREVIAFPKSGGGFDPLTAAPAPITAGQRAEAGIDVDPEESATSTDD